MSRQRKSRHTLGLAGSLLLVALTGCMMVPPIPTRSRSDAGKSAREGSVRDDPAAALRETAIASAPTHTGAGGSGKDEKAAEKTDDRGLVKTMLVDAASDGPVGGPTPPAPLVPPQTANAEAAVLRADAGDDQVGFVGRQMTLNGSRSEPRGKIGYRWLQLGGPDVKLKIEDGYIFTFVPSEPGIYRFALVVGEGGRILGPGHGRRPGSSSGPADAHIGPGPGPDTDPVADARSGTDVDGCTRPATGAGRDRADRLDRDSGRCGRGRESRSGLRGDSRFGSTSTAPMLRSSASCRSVSTASCRPIRASAVSGPIGCSSP